MRLTQAALLDIPPEAIREYLMTAGWSSDELWREHASVFRHPESSADILVPQSRSYADYALRVGDAIQVLHRLEQRLPEEILLDVRFSASDRVVIRPVTESDPVDLQTGVNVLSNTRDLLTGAVLAAHEPRAAYRGRKAAMVAAYLRSSVWLAGDLAKPEPKVMAQRVSFSTLWPYTPVEMLTQALTYLRGTRAAEPVDAVELVESGASRNLCTAVLALHRSIGDGGFYVSTTSPGAMIDRTTTFYIDAEVAETARFLADWVSDLSDSMSGPQLPRERDLPAATRSSTPFRIEGLVTSVSRHGRSGGIAVIRAASHLPVEDVHVALEEEDYVEAVMAHLRRARVAFIGLLEFRQGARAAGLIEARFARD
jgi:hypothetical protein